MRSGDILLFKARGQGFISWLIAWGTKSEYSHVAVCVSRDMGLAIEAITRGGVRARDIDSIEQDYDIFRARSGTDLDVPAIVAYLVKQLNNKYDYMGVLYLGIMKLLARVGLPVRKLANSWQKERDYFCSELCYEAFNTGGGIDIVPQIDEADITSPGDIARSPVLDLIEGEETGAGGSARTT